MSKRGPKRAGHLASPAHDRPCINDVCKLTITTRKVGTKVSNGICHLDSGKLGLGSMMYVYKLTGKLGLRLVTEVVVFVLES